MRVNVVETSGAYHWSIRKMSQVFKIDRDRVRKYIHSHNIQPAGHKNSFAVYDISEIVPFLFGGNPGTNPDDKNFDPEKLPPKERKEWYEGSLRRDEVMVRQGELISEYRVREEMAATIKSLLSSIACLPDEIERVCNLDGKGVAKVESVIDAIRNRAAEEIANLDVRICDCDKA